MEDVLNALEQVPAWREGSWRALERHRAAIERTGRKLPALQLRAAELLRAAGRPGDALSLAEAIDPAMLDTARRERRDFLLSRIISLLPNVRPERTGVDSRSLIGLMRLEMLRAEKALVRRDVIAAGGHWEHIIGVNATGLQADELRYEALLGLGRLLVIREPQKSVRLLRQAADLARNHDASHDESAVMLSWFSACASAGDRAGSIAVGRRAAELPGDVAGAIPPGLVRQITAADLADRGLLGDAVRECEAGMHDAHRRTDANAYGALAYCKAVLLLEAGENYPAFRSIKLSQAWLRKSAPEIEMVLVPLAASLEERVGEEEWQQFNDQLIAEMSARSS